jgi:alanine dehydrogenase
VQGGAGLGSGIADEEYKSAGAEIVPAAAEAWKRADIPVKVKEPLESEYPLMREGQILFTYLHLAPLPALTRALLERKVTGVAYETITRSDGSLPLLTPMRGDSPGGRPAGFLSYSTPTVISSTGMKWLSLCPKIP